eukprot:gene4443-805_t
MTPSTYLLPASFSTCSLQISDGLTIPSLHLWAARRSIALRGDRQACAEADRIMEQLLAIHGDPAMHSGAPGSLVPIEVLSPENGLPAPAVSLSQSLAPQPSSSADVSETTVPLSASAPVPVPPSPFKWNGEVGYSFEGPAIISIALPPQCALPAHAWFSHAPHVIFTSDSGHMHPWGERPPVPPPPPPPAPTIPSPKTSALRKFRRTHSDLLGRPGPLPGQLGMVEHGGHLMVPDPLAAPPSVPQSSSAQLQEPGFGLASNSTAQAGPGSTAGNMDTGGSSLFQQALQVQQQQAILSLLQQQAQLKTHQSQSNQLPQSSFSHPVMNRGSGENPADEDDGEENDLIPSHVMQESVALPKLRKARQTSSDPHLAARRSAPSSPPRSGSVGVIRADCGTRAGMKLPDGPWQQPAN